MKDYLIAAVLLFGAWQSVRMAWADYFPAGPDSAEDWLRFANQRQTERPGDPAVDVALSRALALNPRYAEAWMERASREEVQGRFTEAERDYLTAASVDHRYKPNWELANFYFRRENPEKFWIYGRRCLEVVEPRRFEPASYDPAPLFDLAWRVSQDAREIRRNLIPPRHFLLLDYLEYLRAHSLLDAGTDLAVELADCGDAADTFHLLNFCERLIHSPKATAAVQLWNAMIDRRMVLSERLDPQRGQSLSNADLKRPFARAGFDWRLPPADGVLQNHFPDSGEVRFELSGDQPESVLLMYQSVPVLPGAEYRIAWRFRSPDLDDAGGFDWQVWDDAGQGELPISNARFAVPQGVEMVRLGLMYRRPRGRTRIRGTAVFSAFQLKRV